MEAVTSAFSQPRRIEATSIKTDCHFNIAGVTGAAPHQPNGAGGGAGADLPGQLLLRGRTHKGSCHLLPSSGVVLVVTDELGCETLFGFFQFAESVKDVHGKNLAETGLAGRWHLNQFVDSPGPRFREIVRLFAQAGFLESEKDEFHPRAV